MLPNIGYTNYVLLLVAGKQNATFSPNFTQLRKVLLVQPCISHRHCCHSSTVQCHFHYVAYQLSPPRTIINSIMGLAKRLWTGLVNFVPAVAYHFCLALPAAFKQPGDHLLAEPCTGLGFINSHQLREIGWKFCVWPHFTQPMGSNNYMFLKMVKICWQSFTAFYKDIWKDNFYWGCLHGVARAGSEWKELLLWLRKSYLVRHFI